MFRSKGPVGTAFRCGKLHDTTNPILQSPEGGLHLQEWRVTLHLFTTVCTGGGKRLHTLPDDPTLGEPQGVSWGTSIQQCVQVEGHGCTWYPLTRHWVTLKVLVSKRNKLPYFGNC